MGTRLAAAQTEQLARLYACVHASKLDEALLPLAELARTPNPALIPHLLSPFVPRAFRYDQDSGAWLANKLGALLPPRMPKDERAFRETLTKLLSLCLAAARADHLVHLDEACRRAGEMAWGPVNDWARLDVRSLEYCLANAGEHRLTVGAIGTFHRSGFVRERALSLLEGCTSGGELPFLLLRLNDWVKPVQRAALRAVHARIREEYAPHFARWLLLLNKSLEANRNQLSDIVQWALTLLVTPVGAGSLQAQFRSPERLLRRASLQLACDRLPEEGRRHALSYALRDPDVGTRLWAARIAFQAGHDLSERARDSCGVIRTLALRAYVEREQQGSVPLLRGALFDAATSVRALARFQLTRLEPNLSIADLYRSALDEHQDEPALLARAIAGLSEVGNRDDAAIMSFHIDAQSARVAKAAIHACTRLARADCRGELIAALGDGRRSVSNAARFALACTEFSPTELGELVRAATHTHTRMNALQLLHNLERWAELVVVLEATRNDRAEVRAAAIERLSRVLNRFESTPYLPPAPLPEQRMRIRQLMGALADIPLLQRIGALHPGLLRSGVS